MHQLGILLDNYFPSQIGYLFLKQANTLLSKRADVSIVGFFENVSKPVIAPNFALMHMSEIYGFNGTLIVTNALHAYNTRNIIGPKRRILYAYELDHTKHRLGLPAEFYLEVYRGEVWTRGEDYKAVLDNNFSLDCKINENFDLEKFL